MAPVLTGGHKALMSPVLVPVTHGGGDRQHDPREPLRTITTANGGEFAFATATLVQMGYGEREGQQPRALDLQQPLGTVVAGGRKQDRGRDGRKFSKAAQIRLCGNAVPPDLGAAVIRAQWNSRPAERLAA